MTTSLILAFLLALSRRAFAAEAESAPPRSICEIYVIPERARRLTRAIERATDPDGVAAEIKRRLVAVADAGTSGRDGWIQLGNDLIEVSVIRSSTVLDIKVRRHLSFRRIRRLKPNGLRSPMLNVWRGLVGGIVETTERHPSIQLVRLQGTAMYNKKYERLLGRRLAFGSRVLENAQEIEVWRTTGTLSLVDSLRKTRTLFRASIDEAMRQVADLVKM